MAREINFIADFRVAVSSMLSTFQAAQALVDKADALEWNEESFAPFFTSADITAAEFYTAVNTVRTLRTENAAATLALVKLVT